MHRSAGEASPLSASPLSASPDALAGGDSPVPAFRVLLRRAKAGIREVEPSEGERLLSEGWTLLDVREAGEYEQGAIPGAVHIPRGVLESSIENAVPDRRTPVVALCASGARSAFAVATLAEMGYERVVSLDGGFDRWKAEGRHWRRPRALTSGQRHRYARHLALPEVGETGQRKLLDARVLVLGAGGLGSPAALYLAAAGVGTLGIVDMDVVDESNLQRQVLHNSHRVGERKAESAEKTLTALNPDVDVVAHCTCLDAGNVLDIVADYDVVVDGADNFTARYLLNDASVKLGVPVVHGSVFRFEGRVTVFDPRDGPTFRDMIPEPPPTELMPSCAEAGVLGATAGVVGALQASEAIKLILGIGDSAAGRLVVFDALETSFREFELRADPANEITWANRERIRIDRPEARPSSCTA